MRIILSNFKKKLLVIGQIRQASTGHYVAFQKIIGGKLNQTGLNKLLAEINTNKLRRIATIYTHAPPPTLKTSRQLSTAPDSLSRTFGAIPKAGPATHIQISSYITYHPTTSLQGYSLMVKLQSSKLQTRVRFLLPLHPPWHFLSEWKFLAPPFV